MKIKEGGVMDIQKLTKEQAVIISGFTGILCGEFSDFHADVEKRLGRGVQTFEFGFKEFATEVKKLYEADFIEMGTVDKEQAKAQAMPEWIETAIQPPEEGQKVIISGFYGVGIAEFSYLYKDEFVMYDMGASNPILSKDQVKFWQPLPDAPQEPAND